MAATLTILNKVPYHIVVDFTTFGHRRAVINNANAENISCFVCAVIIETRIRRADLIERQSSARYYGVRPGTNAVVIRTVLFVIIVAQSKVPNLLKRRCSRCLHGARANELALRVLGDVAIRLAKLRLSVLQCGWTRRIRRYSANAREVSVIQFVIIVS